MQKTISLLFFILNALALVVAFLFSLIRKNKELRPIQFYLFFTMLFFFLALLKAQSATEGIDFYKLYNIGILVDLSTLYYYFHTLLTRRSQRRWLLICLIVFVCLALYFWLGPMHAFARFWGTLYGLENIFVTIPCFFYFYQVFNSDVITDFKTNPHFFVVCGLLFFYATTFPFYISYNIMYDVTPEILKNLVIVNNLLSLILYSTIIKAYLCPRPALK